MEPLLTVDQVAKWLNVPKRSAYRLIESGRVRAVRLGKLIRIRAEDINAILRGE